MACHVLRLRRRSKTIVGLAAFPVTGGADWLFRSSCHPSIMPRIKSLPRRSQVKPADTWDLSSLFA
ncbi:MAG TPA: hypothetical protein VG125_26770, partial [Pirellulales bacterium]|nr:hypothetical protein [Pirellulales bacterium]